MVNSLTLACTGCIVVQWECSVSLWFGMTGLPVIEEGFIQLHGEPPVDVSLWCGGYR